MSEKREVAKELNEVINAGIVSKNFTDLFNLTTNSTVLSEYGSQAPRHLTIDAYKGLVFACIDVRAEATSLVKWKLKKNGKEVGKGDYVYDILKKPNPLFTWTQFIYLYHTYLDLFGEVYIYIVKNRRLGGIPVEMWILPSQYIRPVFNEKKPEVISHYELSYLNREGIPNKLTYRPSEVVYFKNPNPKNPARGVGRLELALLENDIHNLSKTYVRNFYKNGAVPQGILTTEKSLTAQEIERLRSLWYSEYGGSINSWKVAILFGGLKYDKISTDPTSQDFIAQAKWSRDDILSIFKVPPVLLGIDVNSRATAEVQEKLFARQIVKPNIVKLEEMINQELLSKLNAHNYEIEFANPVPQDEEIQLQKAKISATFGIATINELRQLIGLEPLEDSIGDELVEPLNLPQGRKPKQDRDEENSKNVSKDIQDILNQIDGVIYGEY